MKLHKGKHVDGKFCSKVVSIWISNGITDRQCFRRHPFSDTAQTKTEEQLKVHIMVLPTACPLYVPTCICTAHKLMEIVQSFWSPAKIFITNYWSFSPSKCYIIMELGNTVELFTVRSWFDRFLAAQSPPDYLFYIECQPKVIEMRNNSTQY